MTIQFRTVTANGLEFGILEEGSGPLALCLHGFPDTARTWRHLLPELAGAGYHAVAPFLRGYSPTSVPTDGGYQVGALVSDANALHEVLDGDENAVLVGHDWGAYAAYGAGSSTPERWRRLVAMSVPPPAATANAMTSYDQVKRSFYIFMFQSPRAEAIVGGNGMIFLDRLWQDWAPGYDASEDVAAVKKSLSGPDRLSAAIGYYRAMINPALHLPKYGQEQEAFGKVPPQPVLYLHGTDDGSLRVESADVVAARLSSSSRVELLPGAGHFPHLERPAEVNEKILSWLGSTDAADQTTARPDAGQAALTELVDRYFAMWNAAGAAERHMLVEAVWAADARYVDPLTTAAGPAAIEAMVAAVRERLGSVRFRRTSAVGTHSDFFRYQWEMLGADGAQLRTGVSFGQVDPAGRLRQLVGFFD